MKEVILHKRAVGDGQPVFITFEAGPTHDGIDSAKRLVKLSAESGADAVKFQIFDPDRLVADRKQPFTYDVLVDAETGRTETVSEPLYDILVRRCLSDDEWVALKAYSDNLGLCFFATVAFDEDMQLLERLGCHSVKIASADVNYLALIRRVASSGMCVQLDTGNATLGEIEVAVDAIRREGNENIIIHQCPSGYPARLESINLRTMQTLKQMFGYPVAFSDHTPGHDMDVAAVALGCNLVEKTITEDRLTRSVEHIMSLEPREMKRFVQTIRDVEVALGVPRRIMHPEEVEKRNAVRRSAFLRSAGGEGATLGELDIEFRRPGYGITPEIFEQLQERVLREDRPAGHMLTMNDIV